MFAAHRLIRIVVLTVSAYSLLKFALFALPYATRRAALDRAYRGRTHATTRADALLLLGSSALGAAMLASGADPISFLGGLFVGATLVQLFFHAFHAPVADARGAPAPHSPLKQMSYAIQDRPQRAWAVMTAYALIVAAGIVVSLAR